ncbi:MAG: NAD(P)-dependent oxidoreductase [Planctomycetes bacterium]|nr:NAD(P)-dependent oxidoreductase [Planctomycetota bacterium]
MTTKRRVLITGSAGHLGRAAVREIKARGHFVRGLDLRANTLCDENLIGSIVDADLFLRAAADIDVMIHLAATPDDADFLSMLVPNNLIGTYNALEAAKAARVKRVFLASSGQVVWWQRFSGPLPIGVDAQPTPRGWYAATKMFAEGAGRACAEAHGMSVVAARLGWCPRDRGHVQELADTDWGPDVYLSPGDAGRFYACGVESDTPIRYEVVYVSSQPAKTMIYDLEPARKLFGFSPQDTWPHGSLDGL